MTKLLTIDLRSMAPRMLRSRGTPSQLVLYGLKNMCARFDAFTRFVTIFPLTDQTIFGAPFALGIKISRVRVWFTCSAFGTLNQKHYLPADPPPPPKKNKTAHCIGTCVDDSRTTS